MLLCTWAYIYLEVASRVRVRMPGWWAKQCLEHGPGYALEGRCRYEGNTSLPQGPGSRGRMFGRQDL